MPVTCEFDSKKKLITMVVDGQISVSDLVSGYQDALRHEQFERDMNVIWDLSRINLTKVPVSDIRKIPMALNKFMPARGDNYKRAGYQNGGRLSHDAYLYQYSEACW